MNELQKNLLHLHFQEFTGRVTLSKDQIQKTIFFRKGTPIYVTSTVRSETLGQMLLNQGRLTEEQYQKALEAMAASKKRQGEVIVELGFMSPYEVYEVLKDHTGKKFENCLLMEGAQVQTDPGEQHLEGIPDLSVDFFRIFLDLAALHGVEEGDAVPRDKAIALTPPGKEYLQKKALKPNEARAVRLLDGTQTYEEIVSNLPGDSAVAEGLVHVMNALGLVEFKEPPLQRFSRPASEVSCGVAESPQDDSETRQVVTIDEKHRPDAATLPIYSWALKLDRPLTELLHVGPTTTKAQIRKAYETPVSELHLDSIEQSYPEKDRKIAEDVFNRLTLAYTILSDDKRRQEYLNDLAQRTPPKEPTHDIAAEVHLQKARMFLTKKQFAPAEIEIKSAIALAPNEPAYLVALADLQIHKATSEKAPLPDSIERTLKKALSLNSADLPTLFQYGLYAKLKGDFEKAASFFSKIIGIAPNHPQALSELRLIHQRLGGKKTLSILKLFKKK